MHKKEYTQTQLPNQEWTAEHEERELKAFELRVKLGVILNSIIEAKKDFRPTKHLILQRDLIIERLRELTQ